MDIDPIELTQADENSRDPGEPRHRWLNPAVGVTVALLATFMGICKVKDDNIVQAMQQAQADKVDHWGYYQARHVREEVAQSTLLQLRLHMQELPAQARPPYAQAIWQYEAIAKEQAQKKASLRQQADQDQHTYDALNFRDDQFDLSDALLAIAISLLAITSLTQLRFLYVLSLLPAAFGVAMGLAGLCGWKLHPDFLISLLS